MFGLLTGLLRRPAARADVGLAADETSPEYGQGYAAGKAKAHHELRLGYWRDHGPGCGCEPCQTVRAVTVAIELGRSLTHDAGDTP